MTTAYLHQNATERSVVFFVRYVFGIWILHVLFDPLGVLATLPFAYYDPVGILRWAPDAVNEWLLSSGGLLALKSAVVAACALCLWPRAFRFAGPLAAVLLTVYQCVVRGFGHVNHAEIPLLLAVYVLAGFALFPIRKPRSATFNPNAVVLISVALAFTFTYSLIGFERLISGGFAVFTGDSIVNYTVWRANMQSYYDLNVGERVVSWAPFATLLRVGYPVVTLAELLAPLVILSRYIRAAFFAVMIPFHVMTLVLMEISFAENVLLYLVLFNFTPLLARIEKRFFGTRRPPDLSPATERA